MRSVLEMTYRADCEYDIFLLAATSVVAYSYDFLQRRCSLVDAEPLPCEFICRPFEAVGNDHILSDMAEAPAGAEGYDQLAALHEFLSGLSERAVGIGKESLRILARCRCMVKERADQVASSPHPDAVFHGERRAAGESSDAVEDGNRIVKRAEWVYAYVESEVLQLLTYIVAEAAAKHHDLV